MDAALARFTALARIAIGSGFVLYPQLSIRPWIGRDAGSGGARLLARALGARDVVLGAGALATLHDEGAARRWLQAAVVADGVDLALTLAHFGELPRGGRELVTVTAAVAVAVGAKIALFPDREEGPS